jgi:DNA-binding CsgD family transcriptional regulator
MLAKAESAVLWDAVLGDAPWTDVVQAISNSVGGPTACLVHVRGAADFSFWFHGFDPIAAGPAFSRDLTNPVRNPIASAMDRAPAGVAFDRRQIVSDLVYEDDPTVGCLREQGVFHGIICKLAGTTTTEAGYWIGFPKHGGDACSEVAGRFQCWAPLLRQALRARRLLDGAAAVEAACWDALDKRAIGVVTVTSDLRIRSSNARGEQIMAGGDGVTRRNGALAIAAPDADRRLRRELRGMESMRAACGGAPIRIRRPSGHPDYAFDLLPARRDGVAATILITDPATTSLPDAGGLSARFGFTAAEARAARLAILGLSKAQIAEQLGLSENTVKSQLDAARGRVGARNMVELVRMIQNG